MSLFTDWRPSNMEPRTSAAYHCGENSSKNCNGWVVREEGPCRCRAAIYSRVGAFFPGFNSRAHHLRRVDPGQASQPSPVSVEGVQASRPFRLGECCVSSRIHDTVGFQHGKLSNFLSCWAKGVQLGEDVPLSREVRAWGLWLGGG